MGAHNAPVDQKGVSASGTHFAIGAAIVVATAFGIADQGVAQAATGADLDAISQCESSGNPRASNGSHFGLFQFDLATWRSVGGSGDPRDASVAEQYARAQILMTTRGTQPWAASQSCWQGKSLPSPVITPPKVEVKVATPPPAARKPSPVKRTPNPIADIPVPSTTAPASTPVFDAARSTVVGEGLHVVSKGDTLWDIAKAKGLPSAEHLYNLNRHILSNPDKIYPGQVLRLV